MSLSSETHAPLPSSGDDRLTFRWWHLAVAALALAVIGLVLFVTIQPVQVLPRMTLAPGYALVDQDGAQITSEDGRGALTLYNFTYTGCQAPACAETGTAARTLQESLAALDTGGIRVRLVTLSFDPERDTPAAMKAWAQAQGADPSIWSVATGSPTQLKNIIGAGFSTWYERQEDGSFRFDPTWVLVDGNNIIRTRYKTATPDPQIFARDVGLIVREVQNSSGANKLAYEAAHLFLCYPD